MSEMGRLRPVALRDIWKSEAQDFTPWLAGEENLALLGETLGIELELEAVEQNVGPFRADILCKDTLSDDWVLIENQLERTDHTHLGQLITYGAGLDAVTIVWIAARVSDEHRAAMDWLNEITDADVRFFALEVELWKIGDSPAAPKFNVVSKPNDWSRQTASAKRSVESKNLTATQQLQLEYWTEVEAKLAERGEIRAVRPAAYQWIGHGIGKTGIGLNFAMNSREQVMRVEIYLGGQHAKNDFAQLFADRHEIERIVGEPLDWQEIPEKNDSRICLELSANPANKSDWQRQHEWIVATAGKFNKAFRPKISRLDRNSPGQIDT